MNSEDTTKQNMPRAHRDPATEYGEVEVRLSLREWIAAGVVAALVLWLAPVLWERVEPFQPGEDYRIPYDLSGDYWLFQRYGRLAAGQSKTLVIGDSVVWGEYVTSRQTLSHYLNALAGQDRFANLGVDGMYPVAMAGLLDYYGDGIADSRVLLHFNPLWLASREHDLQAGKEFRLNHPELIPQFVPDIPVYSASYSDRLGCLVQHFIPLRTWVRHLQVAYLGSLDLPTWTIDHPYGTPVRIPADSPPGQGERPRHEPAPWTRRDPTLQDNPWVELSDSLQWWSFRRSVEILRSRGNTVFVLVGPFNEHMLEPRSRDAYKLRKGEMEAWLRANGIEYFAPDALRSELYADASHPLSEGYAEIARQLFAYEAFRRFDGGPRVGTTTGVSK